MKPRAAVVAGTELHAVPRPRRESSRHGLAVVVAEAAADDVLTPRRNRPRKLHVLVRAAGIRDRVRPLGERPHEVAAILEAAVRRGDRPPPRRERPLEAAVRRVAPIAEPPCMAPLFCIQAPIPLLHLSVTADAYFLFRYFRSLMTNPGFLQPTVHIHRSHIAIGQNLFDQHSRFLLSTNYLSHFL